MCLSNILSKIEFLSDENFDHEVSAALPVRNVKSPRNTVMYLFELF